MKALVLVDLQNDFCPGGALAVHEGDQVIPVANSLFSQFDLVVATQDWHPADHESFASQHQGQSIGNNIDLHGIPQILWPDHCVQGTPGAAFHKDLETPKIKAIFQKGLHRGIDSYSGFFENDQKTPTQLNAFLQDNGVTEIYVLGLATDYCVRFTVLDAIRLGYTVTVVIDGCRGVGLNPGDIDQAVEAMKLAGANIVQSLELLPQ